MEINGGVQESPVYWVAVIEAAIEAGDLTRAAEAQAELSRLGVQVAYKLRRVATPSPSAGGGSQVNDPLPTRPNTGAGDCPSPLRIDLPQLISLREAARYFPGRGGRRVSIQTMYRWANRGVRGVRLRTIRVGGQTCTSEAWAHEFVGAQNGSLPDPLPNVLPGDAEAARRTKIDRELDAAGF